MSTIFLGINHQLGDGPPLVFETMIFDGEDQHYQMRCSTWNEAEDQHREAVAIAKARWQGRRVSPSSARIIKETVRIFARALRRLAEK